MTLCKPIRLATRDVRKPLENAKMWRELGTTEGRGGQLLGHVAHKQGRQVAPFTSVTFASFSPCPPPPVEIK